MVTVQRSGEQEFMRWMWIVFGLICGLGLIIVVVAFVGCSGAVADGCTPEALRCRGTALEVCDADQRWGLIVDCADVTPGIWACCPDQTTCVPAGACGGDAGDHIADAGKMVDAGL